MQFECLLSRQKWYNNNYRTYWTMLYLASTYTVSSRTSMNARTVTVGLNTMSNKVQYVTIVLFDADMDFFHEVVDVGI